MRDTHLGRMQVRELERVEKSLESFLAGLTASMGRSERRHWAGVYVRGLLLDGERKECRTMATRLGQSDQALQQFVSQSPWSADVLLEALAKGAARSPSNYWIIDETSFPKAGDHSAGVQRQYCGALGKKANCQFAVSLHRADEQGGTSQPLAWRLYLPESWSADTIRRQRVGIPPQVVHQSKLDLALGLVDQASGWQVPAEIVLADEAYGGSFEWRAALRQRGLRYCVRVPWTTTTWRKEPRFGVPTISPRGRPAHRRPLLSLEPENLLAIAQALPASAWKRVTWRHSSKGAQRGRFATLSLWAANGWRQGPQSERVEQTALIEWPEEESAPTRYWLAGLGRKLSLPKLVATARARWRVEQDYRELKDELGRDHFEGRGWQGLPSPSSAGHRRVRLPAPGTGPAAPPRTKKACPRPPCRRCADYFKPRSAARAVAAPGATPASTRLTLPDGVLLNNGLDEAGVAAQLNDAPTLTINSGGG